MHINVEACTVKKEDSGRNAGGQNLSFEHEATQSIHGLFWTETDARLTRFELRSRISLDSTRRKCKSERLQEAQQSSRRT